MSNGPSMSGEAVGRRWPWALLICAAPVVASWLAVCHAVLDHPRVDAPLASDAVLVLGPPDPSRMEKATELVVERHLADTLVISTPDPQAGDAPGLVAFYSAKKFCEPRQDLEIICFKPNPSTTQGEAMQLRELARERGWDTVTAVTFDQHITRARMILQRCFPGELRMTAVDYRLTGRALLGHYVRQSAGFLKAWVTPGCDQQLPWKPRTTD